ncbi:aldehyde dehydrogenase family protein [Komagataeibacter xylinus]|uniref:aldehyde dehydrogenase family protein n=1 Tax=Komagataeibacter xylinus TaxID=28448 RepID=UPI00280B92BE|nr:aldehyde dehydrogenase family protein [Komagataeibacter xylinus]
MERLTAGMPIPFGGDRATLVSSALAEIFKPGDALLVDQTDGELMHIAREVRVEVDRAMAHSLRAFREFSRVPDAQINSFFDDAASRLADDDIWKRILAANARDLARAASAGRLSDRLALGDKSRSAMIRGLLSWANLDAGRGRLVEEHFHDGWRVNAAREPVGVVGFVFEARPSVIIDAVGVLRTGNVALLKFGHDARATAECLLFQIIEPALANSGLPRGAIGLIDSENHAATWALLSDRRLGLAVLRGSGKVVRRLGDVARQSGVPTSLHGTGGAWLVANHDADPARFRAVVQNSLDRKVCNTLNVCCVVRSKATELIPMLIETLSLAPARRDTRARIHVVEGSESYLPEDLFSGSPLSATNDITRRRPFAELISASKLPTEWEWSDAPEISLVVVEGLDEAINLFNNYAPRFVVSLISADSVAQDWFYDAVDAPFVGDGFTRWADGQYALDRPELGLSNWQEGRPLGRGAILSASDIFTVRYRMSQFDACVSR